MLTGSLTAVGRQAEAGWTRPTGTNFLNLAVPSVVRQVPDGSSLRQAPAIFAAWSFKCGCKAAYNWYIDGIKHEFCRQICRL